MYDFLCDVHLVYLVILIVCLRLIVPLENFSLVWRRHQYRWRAAYLIYARHLWLLRSEYFLACHNYCDTGHPFIMVISEDPWYSHLLPCVWQWSCHYLFLRLRSVEAGIRTPNLALSGPTLQPTAAPPRLYIVRGNSKQIISKLVLALLCITVSIIRCACSIKTVYNSLHDKFVYICNFV